MHRHVFFVALTLAGAITCLGAEHELPPLDKPDYRVVKTCEYPNARAARADWKPMPGSAPVEVVRAGKRTVLKLPCKFVGSDAERASWDTDVEFDAARCQGLRLRFSCADTSPVAQFSIYLRSGNGWYSTTLAASETPGWMRVTVDKAGARTEGKPAGWSKIDGIRISAWRGGTADTSFNVADIGVFGEDARVVVIRADSIAASKASDGVSVRRYTKNVTQYLDSLDIAYRVMSDMDVPAYGLNGMKLIVLPYNPTMPERTQSEVIRFVRNVGGMLCFFMLPQRVLEAAGMDRGKHKPQEYKGQFASIRLANDGLAGAPPVVGQQSWGVCQTQPVKDKSRTVAYWYDEKGRSTGRPAVIVSDNCVHITNVVLSGDPPAKKRLLLAAVAKFIPKLWKVAAERSIARIGMLAAYRDVATAEKSILAAAGQNKDVRATLARMKELSTRANELSGEGRFVEAIDAAEEARKLMVRAYCGVQVPHTGEFRAFWCHSPFGVSGMSWDEAIKTLAGNGFNAIVPNMLWGGVAYYRSRVLPVAPEVASRGDQLKECVAACKKYGVQCHVWKVCWNMGTRDVDGFPGRMKRLGRTQKSYAGKTMDRWLCPSHAANRKLEVESMVEVANKYDVDGVHFDYIRYPGEEYCFCSTCRNRFEKSIGEKVEKWPSGVKADTRLRRKWLEFRRDTITSVVATVGDRVRRTNPKIKVSAAVFPNLTLSRTSIGQDWGTWCFKEYVDFVCPMDYKPDTTWFENMVAKQKGWAGRAGMYPGIGLSTWAPDDNVIRLIDQVDITRRLNTRGFCIFKYGASQARDIVPLCGLGITRERATTDGH